MPECLYFDVFKYAWVYLGVFKYAWVLYLNV